MAGSCACFAVVADDVEFLILPTQPPFSFKKINIPTFWNGDGIVRLSFH